MLHLSNKNDSKLADYFQTLDENIFSPFLQFGDSEIHILKELKPEYAEKINRERDIKSVLKKKND